MDALIGSVIPFGFGFAPRGWATCEGQTLPISQNQALFSLLGTNFGGDGVSTFCLPDLRGRRIVGQGTGNGLPTFVVGQKSGQESVNVLISNMPLHTHNVTIKANSLGNSTSDPSGQFFGGGSATVYDTADDNAIMAQNAITCNIAGSSMPMEVLNPYLTLYYCICTQGIYPTRN